ncbi:hypothetical protein J2Y45_002968 [Dyadobacter sp. BE34]|uniref:Surface glycan-binding protein B xyloglucan binding domain-containing protein n=1 Tax=Dyadobacter fermentans TaxID=94254 RepID=A0ABU1QU85_9BACT|nr:MULTISPECIES: hypothetical protein [Dyadobacter]MDR6804724.1 hypothetical protein [Dyadobacter fermentans]MDR7043517.1 hypothetical protein [Dyadobacter sp. BE242]MDR7197829.1 hypothetical protein [Dyadobacter sp. BE34]MDR7214738.1 hypothetical protein [Dyadobacter sp. BE31]MDR7262273.1 hypothetical protein [Dyadobacter sp. BE32]
MKKTLYKKICLALFYCMATVSLLLSACEKDELSPPVITEIRNYAASPADTVVQTLQAAQWVVVLGQNLGDVSQVYFGSIPATINQTLATDGSIVVQVPSIPFDSVARDKVNIVTVVNSSGSASFTINITGAPMISHVRNYAAAPKDTVVNTIVPGQTINIVGYNLKKATKIAFQGVDASLAGVIYTDSSVIVKVPGSFTGADPLLANKITYGTAIDTTEYSIRIFDPAILEYYKDPVFKLLTGGIGKEKTWVLDLDAKGVSTKFKGPLYFSGVDYGWDNQCSKTGGDCWLYDPNYESWMGAAQDYGTMTLGLKSETAEPVVRVSQKGISKNGTFSGSYFFDVKTKTMSFVNVVPLNMGRDQVYTKAYVISLKEDRMQLGFRDPVKSEMAIYNYIRK